MRSQSRTHPADRHTRTDARPNAASARAREQEREADRAARHVADPRNERTPHALSGTAQAQTHGAGGMNGANGAGRPLAPAERAPFEARMGHDFSRVRVHTDASAAEAAERASANAYTRGEDIVFGSGQFRPDTPAGQSLLAHELAHVAQQRQAGPGEEGGLVQCQPKDGEKQGAGSTPPSEPFTVTQGVGPEDDFVLFEQDSAMIPVGTFKKAEALLGKYKTAVTVEIHGYASVEGDTDYNINLSAHRAVAIQKLFRAYLPPDSQVVVYAHGAIDKFGGAGHNRRVGVKVTPGVAPAAKVQPTGPSPEDLKQGLLTLPDMGWKRPLLQTPQLTLTPPVTPNQGGGSFSMLNKPPTTLLIPPTPGALKTGLLDPSAGGVPFNPLLGDPLPLMNWKDLSAPFSSRGLPLLDRDYTAIQQMWFSTYSMMINTFGLTQKQAAWVANTGTSAAYDIYFSREHPTQIDKLNRELGDLQKMQGGGITIPNLPIFTREF